MHQRSKTVIDNLQGLEEATDNVLNKHGEFVSTNLIRQVVFELMDTTKNEMEKIKKEVKANKNFISSNESRMKNLAQDIKHLMQQSFTITDLRGDVKELQKRCGQIERNQLQMSDSNKIQLQENDKKFQEMKEIRDTIRKMYDDRYTSFDRLEQIMNTNSDRLTNAIEQVDEKYQHQASQTKVQVRQFSQQMKIFETLYKETQTSIQNTINKMIQDMDDYHIQELKNQDNTNRSLHQLKHLKDKIHNQDSIIGELKGRIESTEDMSMFIERALPIQLHLMVSEHFQAVLGTNHYDSMIKYEVSKMDEIYRYNKTNRGYLPNIGLLNNRLYLFAEHYYKEKKGLIPFVWGRDYKPNLTQLDSQYIGEVIFKQREETRSKVEEKQKEVKEIQELYVKYYVDGEQNVDTKKMLEEKMVQLDDQQIREIQMWLLKYKIKNGDFKTIFFEEKEIPETQESEVESPSPKMSKITSIYGDSQKHSTLPSPKVSLVVKKKERKKSSIINLDVPQNHSNSQGGQGGAMFIINSNQVKFKKIEQSYKLKIKLLERQIQELNKKAQVFEMMIPEEVKQINQSNSTGNFQEFKQITEDREKQNEVNAIKAIYDNAHRVNLLQDAPTEEVKKVIQKERSPQALASGKQKVKKAMSKVKTDIEQAQQNSIKLKAISNSRPMKTDATANFNRRQIIELQELIDQNVDWVQMYLKTSLETKFDDLIRMNNERQEELRAFTILNVNELKAQGKKNFDQNNEMLSRSKKMENDLRIQQENFQKENQALFKYKQRLSSDVDQNNKRLAKQIAEIWETLDKFANQATKNKDIIKSLLESNMIEQLISLQDYQDKKKLNLIGYEKNKNLVSQEPDKTFSVKKDEVLTEATGKTNNLLKIVKMACISYNATPIGYKNLNFSHDELLETKSDLLMKCQTLLESNAPPKTHDHGLTNKTGINTQEQSTRYSENNLNDSSLTPKNNIKVSVMQQDSLISPEEDLPDAKPLPQFNLNIETLNKKSIKTQVIKQRSQTVMNVNSQPPIRDKLRLMKKSMRLYECEKSYYKAQEIAHQNIQNNIKQYLDQKINLSSKDEMLEESTLEIHEPNVTVNFVQSYLQPLIDKRAPQDLRIQKRSKTPNNGKRQTLQGYTTYNKLVNRETLNKIVKGTQILTSYGKTKKKLINIQTIVPNNDIVTDRTARSLLATDPRRELTNEMTSTMFENSSIQQKYASINYESSQGLKRFHRPISETISKISIKNQSPDRQKEQPRTQSMLSNYTAKKGRIENSLISRRLAPTIVKNKDFIKVSEPDKKDHVTLNSDGENETEIRDLVLIIQHNEELTNE